MYLKTVVGMFIMALIIWLAGCSAIVADKRAPSPEPKIVEEDLPNPRAPQTPTYEQPQPPAAGEPLVSPQAEVPAAVDPGTRQPRRYIWKDKKGSQRSWEPSQTPPEKTSR